jgi:glycosyltransferase involved in cell wall biosynthesis
MSLYRQSAAVVSVTHAFVENLAERGIPRHRMHVVTNGADLARFQPRQRDQVLAERLGLEDKFVVGYVGTHGMAHGLATLLEAAQILSREPHMADVRFLFLGDGAEKAKLVATAGEMGLDNVIFLDSVPRDEVAAYWSLLNASAIHLKNTPLFETVIPSKLFECMAMGLPVLHGVAGESAGIVEQEGNGLTFEPENPEALSEAIRCLVQDPDLRGRLAARGPIASKRYDRKALAHRMLSILEAVHAERPRQSAREAEPAVSRSART